MIDLRASVRDQGRHPWIIHDPNLRYVDAKELDDTATKLRGLEVDSVNGEKLGKVEGFIIDANSGRPYHVVVGSGGWFKHKHFLLPIGHVALSSARDRRWSTDLTKDRVERFPGFDKDEFKQLSDADLKRLDNDDVCRCAARTRWWRSTWSSWETAPHLRSPTWWEADFYRPDRADKAGRNVAGASPAQEWAACRRGISRANANGSWPAPRRTTRTTAGRSRAMCSGVDTGGERTYIGDTSEDEDKRRVDAEKAAKSSRDKRQRGSRVQGSRVLGFSVHGS